jgi:hypothetical protein
MDNVVDFKQEWKFTYRDIPIMIKMHGNMPRYFVNLRDVYGPSSADVTVYGEALRVPDCRKLAERRIDGFLSNLVGKQLAPQESMNIKEAHNNDHDDDSA